MTIFSTNLQKAFDVSFSFRGTQNPDGLQAHEPLETTEDSFEEEETSFESLVRLWQRIHRNTYEHFNPLLSEILLIEKPSLWHETFLQQQIGQFPKEALNEYFAATYLKCLLPLQLTEQQTKVKTVVDQFFHYYFIAKGVRNGKDSREFYDAHEIAAELDYKIFAGSPPFKNDNRGDSFSSFIKQKEISIIVDLTNENDHKRMEGESNNSFKYWTTIVAPKEHSVFAKMKTHPEVSEIEFGEKKVQRFNYCWQDGKRTDPDELYAFIEGLSQLKGNRFVHCFAGRGRTGTYIACERLFRAAQDENHAFWVDPLQVISDLVFQGRTIRGPGFVQNQQQFFTICDFVNRLFSRNPPKTKPGV